MSPPTTRFWLHALVAGGVAFIGQTILAARIGLDLHSLFAGVLLATLLVPPISTLGSSVRTLLALPIAVMLGLGAAWLLPPMHAEMTTAIELQCMTVLLAWTVTLCFCTALLTRFIHPTLASAITTVLALAWLTAPIWLGVHAPPIVRFHPLFALNTALIDLGLWPEQPIEYRYLFALGQDVPYLMPTTIWPSVILHAAAAVFCVSCLVFWKNQKHSDAVLKTQNTKHETHFPVPE